MGNSRVEKIRIGDKLISRPNFERHQQWDAATGCINWTGVQSNIGYGFIGYKIANTRPAQYRMMTVHRVALAIKLGRDIAPGLNANHTCHNRLCVNPVHLEEGTQQEKMRDLHQAGRAYRGGSRPGSGAGNQGPYNHRQQGRQYRYTDEEIQWVRTATTDEIQQRYGRSRERAAAMRYSFVVGYTWLPLPANYVKRKPGPRPGTK
jgi:hypothetical protein